MTSSLVGSEMCIRDSGSLYRPRPGRLNGHRHVAGDVAGAGLIRFAPVSYTHLTLPTICSV
eukprot:4460287-Prorocentrum_lima.AAC.1